jgi:type VI secretion system protein ImpF
MVLVSRLNAQQRLMPSLLDRLIDPDSDGSAARQGYGVEQMLQVVRRDLEDLLNTRQTNSGIPEVFVEVHQSIIGYGLPDLTTVTADSPAARAEIGRIVEGIVARFEPRLKDVKATMVDSSETDRTVRFHIEARLNVDPAPEVGFETVLELMTGRLSVRPTGGAA